MSTKPQIELFLENESGTQQVAYPFVESDHVSLSNGMDIDTMIRQDVSMPTVAHEDLSFKVGVGDQDVSSAIVDSSVAEMTIKGKTYQNILPEPSTHVLSNNKEMFKVNEGLDPNVEIVDGVSKSAILSGNTLVNKEVNLNRVSGTNWTKTNNIYTLPAGMVGSVMGKMDLEANTKYIVKYSCSSTLTNIQNGNYVIKINTTGNDYNGNITQHSPLIGENSCTFTTNDITDVYMSLYVIGYKADNDIEVGNFRITKYQEGMENWDIPYFEGMTSVKMPVLTTTGQNLANPHDEEIGVYYNTTDSKEI